MDFLAIAVIINNYLHDVATAVLLSSAIIVFVLWRSAQGARREALVAVYPTLTRLARVALGWIVVGGIPRAIFFTRFEWDPAVTHGIVPALVVKHVLMVAAVAVGAVMWVRVGREVGAEVKGSA